MKKLIFIGVLGSTVLHAGFFDSLQNVMQQYEKRSVATSSQPSSLQTDAIKQALEFGVKTAVSKLGSKDGFYKNPLVKIPLPKNMELVAQTLKKVGLQKYVEQFDLAMNRAAEKAIPQTASILLNTINNLSINDARDLIFSKNDNAITQYFKTHAGAKLAATIAPIIKKQIENEQVTRYYQIMMEYYNKYAPKFTTNSYAQAALGAFGMSAPARINEKDLTSYVTNRALEGLYTYIAQEEKKIRNNPATRTTKILQEVFGATK